MDRLTTINTAFKQKADDYTKAKLDFENYAKNKDDNIITRIIKFGKRTIFKTDYHKKKAILAKAINTLCLLTGTPSDKSLHDRHLKRENLRNMVNILDQKLLAMQSHNSLQSPEQTKTKTDEKIASMYATVDKTKKYSASNKEEPENIYETIQPEFQNPTNHSHASPVAIDQTIYENMETVYENCETASLADSGIGSDSDVTSLSSFGSTDSLDSVTSDDAAEPVYANVELKTTSPQQAELTLGMPTEIPSSPLAPPPEKPSEELNYAYSPSKPAVSKATQKALCRKYKVKIRTVMVNGSPVGYIISNKRAEDEAKPTTLLVEAHGNGVFSDGSKIPGFTTPDNTTFLMPARRNETLQVSPWAQADAISRGQIDFGYDDQIYGDVDDARGSGREMTNYYLSPITAEQGSSYDLNLEKTAQLMQYLKKSSGPDQRKNDFNMLMLDPNLPGYISTEDLMGAFKAQGIDYKHIIMNVCRPQTLGTVKQTEVEFNIQREKNLTVSQMGKHAEPAKPAVKNHPKKAPAAKSNNVNKQPTLPPKVAISEEINQGVENFFRGHLSYKDMNSWLLSQSSDELRLLDVNFNQILQHLGKDPESYKGKRLRSYIQDAFAQTNKAQQEIAAPTSYRFGQKAK